MIRQLLNLNVAIDKGNRKPREKWIEERFKTKDDPEYQCKDNNKDKINMQALNFKWP